MGTSIFAPKYLPRNIRCIGYLSLIGGVFLLVGIFVGGLWKNLEILPIAIYLLIDSVVLFVVAYGVYKKEKWAHILGIVLVAASVLSTVIQFLTAGFSLALLAAFVIEILLLFSFIQSLKDGLLGSTNKLLMVLAIMCIILNLMITFLGSTLVYQIKNPGPAICSVDSDCPATNKSGWTCVSYCEVKTCKFRCSQISK